VRRRRTVKRAGYASYLVDQINGTQRDLGLLLLPRTHGDTAGSPLAARSLT
jgi:hypothetical protein